MRDKVIVITGASGGIGAALSERAAARGARLVLAARPERDLKEVAARCGPQALPVVTDVTRREDVRRILEGALSRFGHVDVWLNNAGRGITRKVSELGDEDLDEMMRVNVKSALYGIQTVLPHCKESRCGHIINVSSMLGRVPYVPTRSAEARAGAASPPQCVRRAPGRPSEPGALRERSFQPVRRFGSRTWRRSSSNSWRRDSICASRREIRSPSGWVSGATGSRAGAP